MKIKEIKAKSILVPSKLPDADYVINPYTGCQFGCIYCYASFMGRFVNESIENWGNYLYVKINAVELLKKELKTLKNKNSTILLSSVTDPYQSIEIKYKLTRQILEVLANEQYPGCIGILTKSPLVLRDIDTFKKLKNIDIGLTITTTDDKLSRFLEVKAPLATKRFNALKELNKNNIKTYAFIGPLLPHYRFKPDLLEAIFKELSLTGTKEIYVEHINLSKYIKERLWKIIANESEEIKNVYKEAETDKHRTILDSIVNKLVKKYNFKLRLNEAIYHKTR